MAIAQSNHVLQGLLTRAKLAEQIRSSLATNPEYAVYHDAYQYFEARFGLAHPVIVSPSNGVPAGAAHLADIRKVFLKGSVPCLFAEPGYSDALATRLTEGTDTKIIVLDPLGAGFEAGPDLYLGIITQMAKKFSECGNR